MSDGSIPASSQAFKLHSVANCIGVRPEFFENSVAPIPTIAVCLENFIVTPFMQEIPR